MGNCLSSQFRRKVYERIELREEVQADQTRAAEENRSQSNEPVGLHSVETVDNEQQKPGSPDETLKAHKSTSYEKTGEVIPEVSVPVADGKANQGPCASNAPVLREVSNAQPGAEGRVDDTDQAKQVSQSCLPLEHTDGSLDFPFLTDEATVNYILKSKTMFIMRGVSGSGKTTIARHLEKQYGGQVCSADHFFMDPDGVYRFDKTKLQQAHTACQLKATQSCQDGVPVVVIDNTNIKRFEMSHYIKTANWNSYHTLIVRPRTSWQKDPDILKRRHVSDRDIDMELLKMKIDTLESQVYNPAYYGWFLNPASSHRLTADVWKRFEESFSLISDIKERFSSENMAENQTFPEGLRTDFSAAKDMLHCTAKYLYRTENYHDQESVKASMGKVFSLTISSYTFTTRTLGARVELSPEQLELFYKEGELEVEQKHSQILEPSDHGLVQHQKGPASTFFKKGFSAHITVSVYRGIPAKTTGDDVIEVCEREFQGNLIESVETEDGVYKYYGDGVCEFVLRQKIVLDCLFHGYYVAKQR